MAGPKRVLVVDDQIIILLALVDQFADCGIEAIPVTSARGALSLIGDGFDAIVTDIEMPGGMNGIELAHIVARDFPSMPIVIASGGLHPRRSDLPAKARFIPKPYGFDDILDAIGGNSHLQAA